MLSPYSFKRLRLTSEVWKLFLDSHLILDIQITFTLQTSHFQSFWWKHIENENYKSYLVNRKQKTMLLLVFRLDAHYGLEGSFSAYPIECASKIAPPKNRAYREENLVSSTYFILFKGLLLAMNQQLIQ